MCRYPFGSGGKRVTTVDCLPVRKSSSTISRMKSVAIKSGSVHCCPLMLALLLLAALNKPADDLVQKVVNVYGGATAWERVASYRETGKVTSSMRSGVGKLDREWQRPDKLRVEIEYPSHTEVRTVDGNKGTQNRREATGMALDAMRLQAARLALPLLLVQKKSELNSVSGNSIEIPVTADMTVTIEVDPATGHILKSTGKAAGVEFTTTYSDFRKVEGLLFAFRDDNTAQGM